MLYNPTVARRGGRQVTILVLAIVGACTSGGHDGSPPAGSRWPSTKACLDRRSVERVAGTQPRQFRTLRPSDNETFDLRSARFTAFPAKTLYPISIGAGTPARRTCVVGGVVIGQQS